MNDPLLVNVPPLSAIPPPVQFVLPLLRTWRLRVCVAPPLMASVEATGMMVLPEPVMEPAVQVAAVPDLAVLNDTFTSARVRSALPAPE